MARYKSEQKEQTRERIISAAERCFKSGGYSGIGVDGLAKEAGVTSGAFYGHFTSKEQAFNEVVVSGFQELKEGVERFQAEFGENWMSAFADYYLGFKRTCDLKDGCALQTLTLEIARSSELVRNSYQNEMTKVIEVVAKGLPHGTLSERRGRAWAYMSMLSGGVTALRGLTDDELAEKAAKSVRKAALSIALDS